MLKETAATFSNFRTIFSDKNVLICDEVLLLPVLLRCTIGIYLHEFAFVIRVKAAVDLATVLTTDFAFISLVGKMLFRGDNLLLLR